MCSYSMPDLPKYSCLSFYSSVSLEPLIPVGPITLLFAISVHGCHTFRVVLGDDRNISYNYCQAQLMQ